MLSKFKIFTSPQHCQLVTNGYARAINLTENVPTVLATLISEYLKQKDQFLNNEDLIGIYQSDDVPTDIKLAENQSVATKIGWSAVGVSNVFGRLLTDPITHSTSKYH